MRKGFLASVLLLLAATSTSFAQPGLKPAPPQESSATKLVPTSPYAPVLATTSFAEPADTAVIPAPAADHGSLLGDKGVCAAPCGEACFPPAHEPCGPCGHCWFSAEYLLWW